MDSRDITELQLKQTDCELIIRKKEALPPPAPVYLVQQPPSSQYMMPTQMAPPPPSSVSTPSPQASAQMPPPVSAQPKKSSLPPLKCPMAGTLYRSPAPGAPPFIKVIIFLKCTQTHTLRDGGREREMELEVYI